MSNSSLVSYTKLSPNHSGARKNKIDRITPHCFVGQVTVEQIGATFAKKSKKAPCNYGIGTDGKVCLIVDEANRSWCSSSSSNDNRAVTIECASDKDAPYTFNDEVYEALIDLCADICRRNGKTRVTWIDDKSKALKYEPADDEILLTVHRWFAAKACPGEWLYSRMGELAEKIGDKLHATEATTTTTTTSKSYLVKVTVSALNIRTGPGTNYKAAGCIRDRGTYTIVETRGEWGRLKSGAGWICLSYTKKV